MSNSSDDRPTAAPRVIFIAHLTGFRSVFRGEKREELRDEGTELFFRVCDFVRKAVDIVLDSGHVVQCRFATERFLQGPTLQVKLQFFRLSQCSAGSCAHLPKLPVYNSCCEAVDSCLTGGLRPGESALR
jgi:hypothetical protein